MVNKKVLIVEDEVIAAMYLRQQLQKHNYDVLKAVGTAEKAINIAQIEKPDIILMDIGLASRINGIEAAREILKFSSPLIIFMTGYQNEEFFIAASAVNAPLMIKPVDAYEVINIIEKRVAE